MCETEPLLMNSLDMERVVTGKKIAVLGFGFKKDTGDECETPSMFVCRDLFRRRCKVYVYDPEEREREKTCRLKWNIIPVEWAQRLMISTWTQAPSSRCGSAKHPQNNGRGVQGGPNQAYASIRSLVTDMKLLFVRFLIANCCEHLSRRYVYSVKSIPWAWWCRRCGWHFRLFGCSYVST